MTKLAIDCPLNKTNLDHDLRLDPVSTHTGQADCFCKRRFQCLKLVELRSKIEKKFCIESSPNLSCKNEVVVFEVTNQQCAESDTLPLRISKTTHDKFLR